MRWIVFDEQTADAVMDKYKRGAAEIHPGGDPLDTALNAGRPTALIMPASGIGRVLLASIEPKTPKAQTKPSRQPVVAQFTPLRRVINKTSAPRKTWWRKSNSNP
jgi:hypothetical protein